MIKTILAFILLVPFLFVACDENDNPIDTDNIQIKYGKSFGECYGYCITELEIDSETSSFIKYGWTDDSVYPDITCSNETVDWMELVSHVNTDSFFEANEVYGCPDCADGGAEWIEVITPDQNHKVTFEYQNEPEFLTTPVEQLRQIMTSFDHCEQP